MSVKLRILIPMIAAAVLAASIILASNIIQFSRFVDSNVDNELERALLKIHSEIEMMQRQAAAASLFFANDPEIIGSLESGDRQALLARAVSMRNDSGVEASFITDAEGTILARSHIQDFYGDNLTSMQCVQSAIAGMPLIATESISTVDMMACAAAPIFNDEGKLLGTVVVGFRLDTEEFVDRQKSITGVEVSVFRGEERVATTLYTEDGVRASGTKAPDNISEIVLAGGTFTGQTKVLGQDILTKYVPITDSGGEAIGMLVGAHFLSDKNSMVGSFITVGLIITIILLGIIFTIILFVSERVSAPINKRLDLVHFDELTGIYNRRYFEENITRVIKSLSRSGGAVSLLMVDVDCFKNYNDTYGHRAGDKCLRIIAETLAESVMRADDFVARYGGEEFVVVLPNTDEDGAKTIADRLLENIRNCNIRHENNDAGDFVSISIGVTTGFPKHTHSGDDYVKRADEMLYNSKQSGKNKSSFAPMSDSAPTSLASAQKALVSLKRKKQMTDILNGIAFTFLARSEKSLEDMLTSGIWLMADSVDIDTISIWRNSKKADGMHMSQIYRWDRDAGGATPTVSAFTDVTYAELAPGWQKLFEDGQSVNSPVRLLPDRETSDALREFGILSVFSAPIVNNNESWGFVLFADRRNDRFFDTDSAEIMRSTAFMFANAIIRDELEREIEKAEQLTKLMLDTSPMCCQLWDRSLNTIDCNEAAVRLYGFKNKMEYLDRFLECCSPEYQPDGQRSDEMAVMLVNKAFEQGYCQFDWAHQMPDGTPMPAEVTLVRVRYKDDYVVAGYTRDLRNIKRIESRLEDALIDAKEANRSKSEFLSRMSHEMLTPMNAIIGMTQILKRQHMAIQEKENLDEIDGASRHLLQLINNLLDVSDNSDGAFALTESAFSFVRMFDEVLYETSSSFTEKQQTFSHFIDPSMPAQLVGDKNRLKQVITCLLMNAVKFTPERGEISFSSSVLTVKKEKVTLLISISDNGIGIPTEHKKHIFNVFEQVDGSPNSKYDGTGLGLPIARRSIELMGGKISVDSQPGKGAKFTFTCVLRKELSED